MEQFFIWTQESKFKYFEVKIKPQGPIFNLWEVGYKT